MQTHTLTLKIPPSTNRVWRTFRRRPILSKASRDFRAHVAHEVKEQLGDLRIAGQLALTLHIYPQRKTADVDNFFKSTLDALKHAGLFKDDNQVTKVAAVRHERKDVCAHVVVEIEA